MRIKSKKNKKNQDYGSKDEIENKLKFNKKKLRIKIRNQNIKGQTLNTIKIWIEGQNCKEKLNSQKNPKQK